MTRTIEDIFHDRTCYHYSTQDIDNAVLQEIYDLMKLGPTSANSLPLRILFVKSLEQRQKLALCVMDGNKEKILAAPVTAIFSYDLRFYDKLDILFPHAPAMKSYFASNDDISLHTATLNSSLQAAYFMMLARAKGLGITPMSGFDMNAVNERFLSNTNNKVSFICALGYKGQDETNPRSPRLEFKDVCSVI